MKILITAATPHELLAAQQLLPAFPSLDAHCVVTGIGVTATAYHTLKQVCQERFDLVINIGIAGSYTDTLPVGAVCRVTKEYFGDTGVRTPAGFSTLFDENLLNADTFPFSHGALCAPLTFHSPLSTLNSAVGVTVQTVSGAQPQIDELVARFSPDIETMEGAAFFYVCLQEKVPFIALRAISNKVEVRDKSKWDIPLALRNLSEALRRGFVALQESSAV